MPHWRRLRPRGFVGYGRPVLWSWMKPSTRTEPLVQFLLCENAGPTSEPLVSRNFFYYDRNLCRAAWPIVGIRVICRPRFLLAHSAACPGNAGAASIHDLGRYFTIRISTKRLRVRPTCWRFNCNTDDCGRRKGLFQGHAVLEAPN